MKPSSVDPAAVEASLLEALGATRGHFRYESGDHGDLWLDLESLFLDAGRVREWVRSLAEGARALEPEVVCGPWAGGALVALPLAMELSAEFVFAERCVEQDGSVTYRVPDALRERVSHQRVLVVDDAINAGSAVSDTLADLLDCSAEVVGLACLLSQGATAAGVADAHGIPLLSLAHLKLSRWNADDCPLCEEGRPLGEVVPAVEN